ncbi:MAG: PH domain-containing protein [Anaerolineae bacterium]|nr:PH domain-containing protein [Anaerolineae bacterium]
MIVEFFFALLPFLIVLLTNLRQSYEGSGLAGTVSYNLLVAIGMTTIQVLIVAISFVAWYLPVYLIQRDKILLRRSSLFEDKVIAEIQQISGLEVLQGALGRRLDYGTLVINSADAEENAYIKDVPNPASYARQIEDLIEPERGVHATPEPRPVGELIAAGEGQYVEFKSSLMWDYRRQVVNKALYEPVMKNIVGFMNSSGGALLIGVDDDGAILGLEADYHVMRKPDSDGFENVFNMAFNKMIGVEYRRFVDVAFPEIEGKQVCAVSVRPATWPAYLRAKGSEAFYVRAGNASQPLTVSQAARYIQDKFND